SSGCISLQQRFSVFIYNHNISWYFIKFQKIISKSGYFGTQCRFIIFRKESIWAFGLFRIESAGAPALQLSAPNSSKIQIIAAIIILEYTGVDGEAVFNSFWLRF